MLCEGSTRFEETHPELVRGDHYALEADNWLAWPCDVSYSHFQHGGAVINVADDSVLSLIASEAFDSKGCYFFLGPKKKENKII